MSAHTYRRLPNSQTWAVSHERPSNDGTPYLHTLALCEREEDAQRIVYCLTVVAESEQTAEQDMRDVALFLVPPGGSA
jgi:hypothetical protein